MAQNEFQNEAKLMELEDLIRTRERIPSCELSIPLRELCERYEKLYTGAINDVLRERCLLDQALPPRSVGHRRSQAECELDHPGRAIADHDQHQQPAIERKQDKRQHSRRLPSRRPLRPAIRIPARPDA